MDDDGDMSRLVGEEEALPEEEPEPIEVVPLADTEGLSIDDLAKLADIPHTDLSISEEELGV